MKKILTTIAISALTVFFCIGGTCDKPVEPTKKIELTSPRSGAYNVGQIVAVNFVCNSTDISQVIAQVSIDNGFSWKDIADGGVEPAAGTISWEIGAEYQDVPYQTGSNSVKLRVANYTNDNINDVSNAITITKQ